MLKAISLWNPWAMLVMLGLKKFETRHWSTSHRGEIAIHAAKHCELEAMGRFSKAMAEACPDIFQDGWERYSGKVLCVVTLGAPLSTNDWSKLIGIITDKEKSMGNYSVGRLAWPMTDVKRLKEPVATRGFQQIWTLPPDVEEQVRKHLL